MMLVVKDLRVRQVVSCQLHSENPRKLPNLAKNELLSKMNLLVHSMGCSTFGSKFRFWKNYYCFVLHSMYFEYNFIHLCVDVHFSVLPYHR